MILTYPMECYVSRHCLTSIIKKNRAMNATARDNDVDFVSFPVSHRRSVTKHGDMSKQTELNHDIKLLPISRNTAATAAADDGDEGMFEMMDAMGSMGVGHVAINNQKKSSYSNQNNHNDRTWISILLPSFTRRSYTSSDHSLLASNVSRSSTRKSSYLDSHKLQSKFELVNSSEHCVGGAATALEENGWDEEILRHINLSVYCYIP